MLLVLFLKGIVVGAVIAVPVGPVGIICLRKAIFEGQPAGLVAGTGAATADAFFGIVAAFGLTFVARWLLGWEDLLRAAGGCYLLFVGAHALVAPPRAAGVVRGRETLLRDFFSTFALTLTNPITILVFLGIFEALGLSGGDATLPRAAILVAGVWAGSFLWWLGLSLGVGLFRRSIGPRQLAWIGRGSGAILFLSGAALVVTTVLQRLSILV